MKRQQVRHIEGMVGPLAPDRRSSTGTMTAAFQAGGVPGRPGPMLGNSGREWKVAAVDARSSSGRVQERGGDAATPRRAGPDAGGVVEPNSDQSLVHLRSSFSHE